jgi:hypothetical protein
MVQGLVNLVRDFVRVFKVLRWEGLWESGVAELECRKKKKDEQVKKASHQILKLRIIEREKERERLNGSRSVEKRFELQLAEEALDELLVELGLLDLDPLNLLEPEREIRRG